ncbi:hypothetical protein MGH68_04485 [Erysipelothrix sp. D19-032]
MAAKTRNIFDSEILAIGSGLTHIVLKTKILYHYRIEKRRRMNGCIHLSNALGITRVKIAKVPIRRHIVFSLRCHLQRPIHRVKVITDQLVCYGGHMSLTPKGKISKKEIIDAKQSLSFHREAILKFH